MNIASHLFLLFRQQNTKAWLPNFNRDVNTCNWKPFHYRDYRENIMKWKGFNCEICYTTKQITVSKFIKRCLKEICGCSLWDSVLTYYTKQRVSNLRSDIWNITKYEDISLCLGLHWIYVFMRRVLRPTRN